MSDVAEAIGLCTREPDTCGKVYELGGPESHTLRKVIEMIAASLGRRPVFIPVPLSLARLIARLLELFPSASLTFAQVDLLEHDNVPAANLSGIGEFASKMRQRNIEDTIAELTAI